MLSTLKQYDHGLKILLSGYLVDSYGIHKTYCL